MFMDRFNKTLRQVRNIDQRLIEAPQAMAELQDRLESFTRIEEGCAYQRRQKRRVRRSGIRRSKWGRRGRVREDHSGEGKEEVAKEV